MQFTIPTFLPISVCSAPLAPTPKMSVRRSAKPRSADDTSMPVAKMGSSPCAAVSFSFCVKYCESIVLKRMWSPILFAGTFSPVSGEIR